jgi:hypothetical protein
LDGPGNAAESPIEPWFHPSHASIAGGSENAAIAAIAARDETGHQALTHVADVLSMPGDPALQNFTLASLQADGGSQIQPNQY